MALLEGDIGAQDINLAARIIARFSSGREAEQVEFQVTTPEKKVQLLTIKSLLAKKITEEWYI